MHKRLYGRCSSPCVVLYVVRAIYERGRLPRRDDCLLAKTVPLTKLIALLGGLRLLLK